jgi:hypothetical protein
MIEHLDNVLGAQACGSLCFIGEPVANVGILGVLGIYELDRNPSPQTYVDSLPDGSHPAAAYQPGDAILARDQLVAVGFLPRFHPAVTHQRNGSNG